MATAKDLNQSGLFSARPAASLYLSGVLFFATDTGDLWRCDDDGGDWTVISSGAAAVVAWGDITGKPLTFAPSSHTHVWADTTDKPTTFAPSSHTHVWADTTDKPSTFAPSTHHHNLLCAFDFQPEYPGAIFVPDTLGSGTLTPFDDTTNKRSAYRWTTTEVAAQGADIIIRFRLPPSFSALGAALTVASRVSDISGNTGVQLVEFLSAAGVNVITQSTVKSATWVETSYAISGGSFAAGDRLTIRARLIADTNDTADLGAIYLPYTAVGEN